MARLLYVAQGIALRRVELASGAVTSVAAPASLALLSIDGLYWHRGRLIAVQNGGGPGRILALDLSPDGRAITGFQVLEAGDPGFDLPTTGTMAGDRFTFIANSQLRRLGDDGRLTAGPPLAPIRFVELFCPAEVQQPHRSRHDTHPPGMEKARRSARARSEGTRQGGRRRDRIAAGADPVRVHRLVPLHLPGLLDRARQLSGGAGGAVAEDGQGQSISTCSATG